MVPMIFSSRPMRTKFYFLLVIGLIFFMRSIWSTWSNDWDKLKIKVKNYIDSPITYSVGNYPVEFLEYFRKNKIQFPVMNASCASFQDIGNIYFHNIHWQVLETTNGTFQLYSAFYDNRILLEEKPIIRILGMYNKPNPTIRTHCQLWFKNITHPVFSEVHEYSRLWRPEWGTNQLNMIYLITCKIPKDYSIAVPEAVSLVEKPCDQPRVMLKVEYNIPIDKNKKDFAVCVKAWPYTDTSVSVKIIEWLELLFLLGADKVFMYDFNINPQFTRVLKYYESKGKVDISPLTLPGSLPNAPGLLHSYFKKHSFQQITNELITYNDCLYRNIYRYKYIALLDIDEVIMPRSTSTWRELITQSIEKINKEHSPYPSCFVARHVYFLDNMKNSTLNIDLSDIPDYMHMLKHVVRAKQYQPAGYNVKSFHNTETVITLHNHLPFSCINYCHGFDFDPKDAHLQHYRPMCYGSKETCESVYMNHTVVDTSILKHKDLLIKNVNIAWRDLNLANEE